MRTRGSVVAAAVAMLVSACGGGTKLGLSSEDNNPANLARAFSLASPPAAGTPRNQTGKPLVFLVGAGAQRKLIAYDLAAKQPLWSTDADVQSRVVVGRAFVAHLEGQRTVVGRDVASGKKLWSADLDGTFLGLAADADRVFYVVAQKSGARPTWVMVALDGGGGSELWRTDAPGQLGAPAARGGLVFSPFLKQWLAILDARTGDQIARIRGIDEEISFVRTTGDAVYYGSAAGVFLLDQRSASGKRAESTYGTAGLPTEFVRSFYHFDAFDPIQAGYSAYDRNRILWRAHAEGDALAFDDQAVVVHHYRFVFGFEAGTGQLKWAYSHPRNDLVSSDHLGAAVGVVSQMGELGALDPVTGMRTYAARVDARVLGATFDAEGWKPAESGLSGDGSRDTRDALTAIALDKDARFNDVKMFAVTALGRQPGGDVAQGLLALIQSDKTPPKVHAHAVDVLVGRKDPAGLPFLLEALATRHDFVTGQRPLAVGVVARAIAAIAAAGPVDAELRGRAAEALTAHLLAPATLAGDLESLAKALAAVGGTESILALRRFLLLYRADPAFSTQIAALAATIDGLLAAGAVADRELVAFVAEDPTTQPGIAEYAAQALAETARRSAAAAR